MRVKLLARVAWGKIAPGCGKRIGGGTPSYINIVFPGGPVVVAGAADPWELEGVRF